MEQIESKLYNMALSLRALGVNEVTVHSGEFHTHVDTFIQTLNKINVSTPSPIIGKNDNHCSIAIYGITIHYSKP